MDALAQQGHLGDRVGRFPTDRGFDDLASIPRTPNESMFTSSPGFDATVVDIPYVMESRKKERPRKAAVYDLDMRRRIDSDLVERTVDFMQRHRAAHHPFFAYLPLTQLHYPTIPHVNFTGRTGAGDFGDALAEMDHRVGQVLDAIDALGVTDSTLLIFTSDNGPEFRRPWRGTAGPWQGTYHTAMQGGLRAPFIAMMAWPHTACSHQ
jgi:arylsulfatase A-like enzyme